MPNLSQSEVITLFKMYEDKGWAVKQQVNSIVAWLTPIIFVLLTYFAKESCSPTPSSSGATNLALVALTAAVPLSATLCIIIFGSLRHADRDYQKADKVMRQNAPRFPSGAFAVMMQPPPRLFPVSVRWSMPTIGGMHILLANLSLLLFAFSLSLWTWPVTLTPLICRLSRQVDLLDWWHQDLLVW